MKNTWGFIGCGNLAQAIIRGAINAGVRPASVIACDRSTSKLNSFSKQTRIKKADSSETLLKNSKFIFLATKPQDLLNVLKEISTHIKKEHVIISVAAGVEASLIKKFLPQAGAVVRVMASTPVQIGEGVFGIYFLKANLKTKKIITKFFENLGLVILLKNDSDVDTITSGSASGVGFVFEMMRVFEEWFIQKGLTKNQARKITEKVFVGSAKLAVVRSNKSLTSLREAVTSKNGTTMAGLRSMKRAGLQQSLKAGLNSGKVRAQEISKSLRWARLLI